MSNKNENAIVNEVKNEDLRDNKNTEFIEMSERDQELARESELKIERLKNFIPSGDVWNDCNSVLELSGRDTLYKKVDNKDLSFDEVLSSLMGLRVCWKSLGKNEATKEYPNLAKQLYFVDLPREEIDMIDRVIESYTNKFSGGEEKKYKKVEAFAEALYGNIDERNYQKTLEDVDKNGSENKEELTPEDKKLCEKWEKETESVKSLKISGNIAEDFNKFVELTDDDKLSNRANLQENPNSVLLNFVKMQTTWENSLAFHGARPTEQKSAMRETFLKSLAEKEQVLKSFIEYYKVKQKL